jgi:hypothetical protein
MLNFPRKVQQFRVQFLVLVGLINGLFGNMVIQG